MRIIIALFVAVLLWAAIGRLDIVAVAPGQTVPGGRTKIIQPLEAAVVSAIHVRDGQRVQAGDVLIELDSALTGADLRQASDALQSAVLAEARSQALLDALDQGRVPRMDPTAFAATPAKDNAELHAVQTRLVQSEYTAHVAKREALDSQLQQREAELATTRELITHLVESERIARARVDDLRRLLGKNYVARHDVLAAEQSQVEAERDLSTQRSRVTELEAAIRASREERGNLVAEFRRSVLDGLRQAREQRAQYTEEATKSERRDERMRLTAPVTGTVQQLAVHTVGGVVSPAQPLMAIVPEGESLEVEAMVLNKDIGFVREGQEAVVKIESFPYTRYGFITGEVVSVSHDAIQNEQLGLVFQSRIRIDRDQLNIDGVDVRLSAGMSVSAEIKTGSRRVIDYLLSPLTQHAQEAMRER